MLVGVMCCAAVPVAAAQARPRLKLVRYRGAVVRVPSSWPVFDLARHSQTCVRFDRHAVYLGPVGAQLRCPPHSVGRTEALLLTPGGAEAAAASARGALPSGADAGRVVRGRVVMTATWNAHPELVRQALGLRHLPGAAPGPPAASRAQAATVRAPARASTLTKGLGFDPCATPSAGAMHAWLSSPYRTVGVYLGGVNMACAQPNLTASWVTAETAAGWTFIPTYVGLQAPGNSCGCASITPARAAAQGTAAADDAVMRAQAVGLGTGNPIFYDMEAYPRGSATNTALTFLAAWTAELHRSGYVSGIYSSAGSGISDLVAAYGTSYTEPDDIWFAHWNDAHTVSDVYVPAADWAQHQRLHQYSGGQNVTYGGVTMNIDGDYIDGATAGAGAAIPDGTFVQVSGTDAVFRIAGGSPLLVYSWDGFGGPQDVTQITLAQYQAMSSPPRDGAFITSTAGPSYRVAGGTPFPITDWTLFGGVQPSVTIDQWDLDNMSNPAAHLNAQPADGTLVQGLPSRQTWRFRSGIRRPAAPSPFAVAVEDVALQAYPVDPSAPPACTVPRLRGLTLGVTRHALAVAHCRLGAVHRPRRSRHRLHVSRQAPQAAAFRPGGWRVAITLH